MRGCAMACAARTTGSSSCGSRPSGRAATSSTWWCSPCASLLGIDYRLSSVIAFVVSVVNNFWWNRHWTFDAKHDHPVTRRSASSRSRWSRSASPTSCWWRSSSGTGMEKVVAQAIAIAAATPLSFLGQKLGASGVEPPRSRTAARLRIAAAGCCSRCCSSPRPGGGARRSTATAPTASRPRTRCSSPTEQAAARATG